MSTQMLNTPVPSSSHQEVRARAQNGLNDELVQAAYSGNISLVWWFLGRGASVDYWQDSYYGDFNMEEFTFRSSALLAACQQGHLEVVLALYRNAKKKERIKQYWPILVETLRNRHHKFGICAHNEYGEVIDIDHDPFVHNYEFLENLDLLRYLLDCGADANIKCQSGKTPLMKAASNPRLKESLELLILAGADVNAWSRQHQTALSCAARCGNIEAMKILLENGADLETSCEGFIGVRMCVPLAFSVFSGNMEQVLLLLKYGARPTPLLKYALYKLGLLDLGEITHYHEYISFLHFALLIKQPTIARCFVELCFLSPFDLTSLPNDENLRSRLEAEEEEEDQETFKLYQEISSKPWPLSTFCIMGIRKAVGFSNSVEENMTNLGLPRPLVKKLLYSPP